MNELTKKEFEYYLMSDGYFLVICDDESKKEEFINEIKEHYSNIEILSDYTFNDPWSLRDKLKLHPVLLLNVEEKLKDYINKYKKWYKEKYSTEPSNKECVYLALIGLREYLRINPVLLLCNSKTAYDIFYNDIQLSAFARNYIYVDDNNYPKKFISQRLKKKDNI